jgi:hypothetical protein
MRKFLNLFFVTAEVPLKGFIPSLALRSAKWLQPLDEQEVTGSYAGRRQQWLRPILEATLGRKLALPKRQLRNIEDFPKAFPEAKEAFIDGTERPIQRPKDNELQKTNYSGKKKRHTRKNLILSTRTRHIGFLSRTVESKEHDITILKA